MNHKAIYDVASGKAQLPEDTAEAQERKEAKQVALDLWKNWSESKVSQAFIAGMEKLAEHYIECSINATVACPDNSKHIRFYNIKAATIKEIINYARTGKHPNDFE